MQIEATSNESVIVTNNEFATRTGLEYPVAAAFIKVLIAKGVATELPKRESLTKDGKKCKPSNVYSLPKSFTVTL